MADKVRRALKPNSVLKIGEDELRLVEIGVGRVVVELTTERHVRVENGAGEEQAAPLDDEEVARCSS